VNYAHEEGLFIEAIQRHLRRKHLTIRWYEHELLTEIRGQPVHLQAKGGEKLCATDQPVKIDIGMLPSAD
jgi:hypothetical protein